MIRPLISWMSIGIVSLSTWVSAGEKSCAVVKDQGGVIQALDATRTELLILEKNSAIPCGAWLSVESGWIQFQHVDGFQVQVGENSFVEVKKSESSENQDQIKLLYGSLYVESLGLGQPLHVVTANGRVRIKDGKGIALYPKEKEETQWLSLSGNQTLENRYQSYRKVNVRSGEISSLNFKLMRTIPDSPQAVSLSSVKSVLKDFRLDESARSQAFAVVNTRNDRKFPSIEESKVAKKEKKAPEGSLRVPASYDAHEALENSTKPKVGYIRGLGRDEVGNDLLYPKVDPKEKSRVLQELKRITP